MKFKSINWLLISSLEMYIKTAKLLKFISLKACQTSN